MRITSCPALPRRPKAGRVAGFCLSGAVSNWTGLHCALGRCRGFTEPATAWFLNINEVENGPVLPLFTS